MGISSECCNSTVCTSRSASVAYCHGQREERARGGRVRGPSGHRPAAPTGPERPNRQPRGPAKELASDPGSGAAPASDFVHMARRSRQGHLSADSPPEVRLGWPHWPSEQWGPRRDSPSFALTKNWASEPTSLGYLTRACMRAHVRLYVPLISPWLWVFSGDFGDSATGCVSHERADFLAHLCSRVVWLGWDEPESSHRQPRR